MRQTLLISALFVCILLIAEARGMNNSHLNYKLTKLMHQQKTEHMAEAMAALGADVSNITIQIRNYGDTLALNGSVPTQEDLALVNLVVEKYGPFKNLRNYIKVKPYEAKDGIVVEVDVFRRIPKPVESETNHCAVCAASGSCEKLYEERQALLKQLRPLYKRRINDRYVVLDEKALEPLKRFREVSALLDASLCYAPTGQGEAEASEAEKK